MFGDFETIILFVSVILVSLLIMCVPSRFSPLRHIEKLTLRSTFRDGKSNYMEGLMLLALYLIVGVAMWVS